jgi:hypothetical protein
MTTETKAKHTPRPWTHARMFLGPNVKDRRCGFVINGPTDVDVDLPRRICDLRVPRGIDGFAEGEANARLIAAAPDLLAALEGCVKWLECDEHMADGGADDTYLEALRERIRLTHAVIAKATDA